MPDGWQPWESLGVTVGGDPVAASWGPDRIDLFVRDTDGALLHGWWDGATWSFAAA